VRAAVIREFGDASGLRPEDVPEPASRPGWTVVRLRAAALNWHDVLVRRGQYGSALPHVPGADGAGVTPSGAEVMILPSLWWGDDESAPAPEWEILGDHRPGTYAHSVAVPDACLFPKPPGLDWFRAAALPLVGVTVFRALVTRARLRAGEWLLVLGSGGGVATAAVRLGVALDCAVTVTSSTPDKVRRAVELGATGGVLYTEQDWADAARRRSPGGRGFDVVLDPVGSGGDALAALRPGGRLVVIGASRAEQITLDARRFYFGQYDLLGSTMGSPKDFAGLLALQSEHDLAPPVDRIFGLGEADRAHAYLESGQSFGKVVLDCT
jgi:zinc-binding alcohol dehydrogenase/oxidoreductase